ncbi:hypothetical protein A3A03_01570 [Candidatus Nomurabacteria bacterium RIFCSPLOWO2_01_FULL_40_18]|uniref:Caib/baif family protein n=1 Tax=Candidatus Nomurabacteria bacterium RIFCSPLOWO2_01_FULL_40_18 TaxID=1801773 RepID=A0A1F6XJ16_9BACT|nr:MAG: hypothetical protein A3A03_01570 [Candidatus Nomurabacteria bacterium RIFCSPLOWO2_01_FULL_40_18]
MTYGHEYDFSIPFFNQFHSLQSEVPKANLHQTNFIRSEYCNYGLDFKECYLLFGGNQNEGVYFGNQIFDSRDSLDIAFSEKVELSYEIFECQRANKLFFSNHCTDCIESYYLIDCRNCLNCFGCVGLVNKQYYIFNEPYTKEKYQEFIKSNDLGNFKSHKKNLAKLQELSLEMPRRYSHIYKCVNSDGDDLSETRNTHNSFTSRQTEDSKYLFFCRNNVKDCYDNSFQGFNSELLYEIASGFGGSNTAFGVRNLFNQNSHYNEECENCSNIFGCEGLRKKQYCILNKQYTKEEYEKLLPKIIEHMNDMPYIDAKGITYKYGEFFPSELSPFAYNETIAQEYFPLTKAEALKQGYSWQDTEDRNYKIDVENKDIPDNIQGVADDIVNKVIACEHSGKCKDQCTEAFKIIPEEFKFYKRMNLPLPRLCPNCRHYQRINQRNPLKLWNRQCVCDKENHFHGAEKCEIEFKTTYAPDRPEIVYCEKCYQQEVY